MIYPVVVSGFILLATLSARAYDPESSIISIRPCPNKPNCVSSVVPDGPRSMKPIQCQGALEDARERLLGVIRSFPRSAVVQNDGIYLKAEFRSALFSFVDDVEFQFDDASKCVHFRSASRLGYYDFGANRKRMENITRQFSGKWGLDHSDGNWEMGEAYDGPKISEEGDACGYRGPTGSGNRTRFRGGTQNIRSSFTRIAGESTALGMVRQKSLEAFPCRLLRRGRDTQLGNIRADAGSQNVGRHQR